MTKTSWRFFLPVCLAGILFAQGDRGSITGAITDAGGARIPAVRITATQRETNAQFKATTNESGEFVLPSLPIGAYRVVIESEGFKSAARDNVRLESGSTVRLDTQLELGSVQQSIEIQGQSSQLQTDSAKIANQIPNKLIEDLPTVVSGNMRSPFDLANITAQVSGGDQDFRIGGGQQGTFGVMLDGASANTNRAGFHSLGGGQCALPRCHHGIHRRDQRVQSRIRPRRRRRHQLRLQVGHQRLSRHRVRLHPQ